MSARFNKIMPQKVSGEIVKQIKALIKNGELNPGEKLPTERQLADSLGVGRSSLREAINTLETLGFVEIKKRKGIFVRSVSASMLSNPIKQILDEDNTKVFQLYELRKDIELASAFIAAKTCTKDNIDSLAEQVKKMETDTKDLVLDLADDLKFHLTIAQATKNFFRAHILKSIFDLSNEYMQYVQERVAHGKENLEAIFNQHEKLFKAIEAKNQEEAKAAMSNHLSWVESNLISVNEKWKDHKNSE